MVSERDPAARPSAPRPRPGGDSGRLLSPPLRPHRGRRVPGRDQEAAPRAGPPAPRRGRRGRTGSRDVGGPGGVHGKERGRTPWADREGVARAAAPEQGGRGPARPRGPGLHGVTFEDVFGAGRRGVPVSASGSPTAAWTWPTTSSRHGTLFGPGSALYFVASPAETRTARPSTSWNGATGHRHASGERRPRGPGVTEAGRPWPSSRTSTTRRHCSKRPTCGCGTCSSLRWRRPIRSRSPDRRRPPRRARRLRVVLQGASDFEAEVDHHLRLSVNGSLVAETTWGGRTPTTV